MSIQYNIKIRGVIPLIAKFKASPQVVKKEMGVALKDSLVKAVSVAKSLSPVKTGKLKESIRIKSINLNTLRGEITTGTDYSAAVEVGAKPHIIVPKKAKILAFQKGGKLIFARKVNHPGFKGRFYMRETVDKTRAMVRDSFKKAALRITNSIKK